VNRRGGPGQDSPPATGEAPALDPVDPRHDAVDGGPDANVLNVILLLLCGNWLAIGYVLAEASHRPGRDQRSIARLARHG
jgi:hypothetical protein